ncbi:MAG: hypothetical protein Kow0029_00320 [Candidatus Rifleibacteriota bacterium]
MLIHIGQNEFVDFKHCEAILNLQTIDEVSKKRILSLLGDEKCSELRSVILTTDGKWIGSTLSPEALAQRGICHPFQQAVYLKKEWKKSSHYRYKW